MKQHPFDGERLSYEERLRFWDDRAETYSSTMQGRIVDDVVHHLSKEGIISQGSSVLELGCGPGTYSLKIAPLVERMVCVDSSPKMIKRMESEAERCGVKNIVSLNSDFFELDTSVKFDVVISSLCPGTSTPEGLKMMSSLSSEYCVHIMWIRNLWDDVHTEIWERLGKNYSFESRKNDVVSPYLKEIGKDPSTSEFHADIDMIIPFEDVLKKETASFSIYGQDEETISKIAEDVLSGMREGDGIRCKGRNSMRLIVWREETDDA